MKRGAQHFFGFYAELPTSKCRKLLEKRRSILHNLKLRRIIARPGLRYRATRTIAHRNNSTFAFRSVKPGAVKAGRDLSACHGNRLRSLGGQ